MILLLKITFIVGIILLPIIGQTMKGEVSFAFVKGFVVGLNYETFKLSQNDRLYRYHSFEFHLICLSTRMAFLKKIK